MERTFPKAWAYLRKYETELRERESSAFDDDEWYRFGRNQNIDKQDSLKLGVAQTVPSLRVFADCDGEFCFNNVRVNGIIPQDADDLFLLLGILNSPTANWCFTRIAKPKDNGYYESNKQFIAPLPIPKVTSDCSEVAKLAETLQEKHTSRRKRIDKLQKRIDSPGCIEFSFKEDWLWADVKTAAQLKHEAPDAITSARERTAWAKAERQRRLDIHHEKVNAMLYAGMRLEATHDEDAVHVRSEHQTLLSKYGLDRDEAELIAVLWSQILRSTNVTAKFTSEALVKKLLKFRSTEDEGLRNTIIKINGDITELDAEIADTEDKLNQLTYKLYDLTPEEIALVESANL
jgi:uncharacterized coiled-coil protein SlyX